MKLNWLLVFIPVAIALDFLKFNPILVFVVSALAIVPLAGLMGDATEALAEYLGPTLGALLNATLGNAPEIIISLFALNRGLDRHCQVVAHGFDHRQSVARVGPVDGCRRAQGQDAEIRFSRGPDQWCAPGACVVRVDHPGDLPDRCRRRRRRAGTFRSRSR